MGETQEEFDKRQDFNKAMDSLRDSLADEKAKDAKLIAKANKKAADDGA